MGCKLSVSVVHPESIVNKIKETMSPNSKRSRKMSDPNTSPKKIIGFARRLDFRFQIFYLIDFVDEKCPIEPLPPKR